MEKSKIITINISQINKGLKKEILLKLLKEEKEIIKTKIIKDKVLGLRPNMVIVDDVEKAKTFSTFKNGKEIPFLEAK